MEIPININNIKFTYNTNKTISISIYIIILEIKFNNISINKKYKSIFYLRSN
jgi:hypothetical protein